VFKAFEQVFLPPAAGQYPPHAGHLQDSPLRLGPSVGGIGPFGTGDVLTERVI
jgi:hypothetical protein